MYFQQSEHNPPHIHAIYGEHVAAIDFQEMKVIEGELPNKALEQVLLFVNYLLPMLLLV